MLINIVGHPGAGKTLKAVMLSLKFLKSNHVAIHSNLDFKEVPYTKLSLADLIGQKISNAVVLLDEAYNYLHARNSMSDANQMMGTILFQSRKTDLILILTEQLQRSIDVYYRELTDLTIKCENYVTFFEYTYLFHKLGQHYTMRLHRSYAERFFRFYNTKQIIYEDNGKNKAIMFHAMSPEQKEDYIKELTEEIINDSDKPVEKITKTDIKNYCMIHDLKSFLIDAIFSEINDVKRK